MFSINSISVSIKQFEQYLGIKDAIFLKHEISKILKTIKTCSAVSTPSNKNIVRFLCTLLLLNKK